MNLSHFEEMNILKYDFPLSTVCSMRTGGNARYAFFPHDKVQLREVLDFLKTNNIKYRILGNGSNTIFSDTGFDGAVIITTEMKSIFEIDTDEKSGCKGDAIKKSVLIYVSCGYSLTSLSAKVSRCGYTGLEFSYGIPASIGGAVFMNAGAYGGEIKDVIQSVEYITPDGEFACLENDADKNYFSYRHSWFTDNRDCVITGVILKLLKAEDFSPMEIAEKNMRSRKEKQPLEYPSCGSAFKRPEGHFAGALIEQAGLKGKNIGGAYVSEKHAGFIVNKGGASTSDVMNLIEYVKNAVYESSGVMLEPEIKVVEN